MKKMLLVLSLLVLAASMAWAFPGPDSMGIYLDPTNTGPAENCANIPVFTPTNIYMCITNISGAHVLAWEARITDTGTAANMIGNWVMSGLDVDMDEDDFVIGNGASPLVPNAQDVVVLGSMQVIVLNNSAPIEFTIQHIPASATFPNNTPGYVAVLGVPTPCVTATGGSGTPFVYNPTFRINGNCIVGNEDASWGQVKSLYK